MGQARSLRDTSKSVILARAVQPSSVEVPHRYKCTKRKKCGLRGGRGRKSMNSKFLACCSLNAYFRRFTSCLFLSIRVWTFEVVSEGLALALTKDQNSILSAMSASKSCKRCSSWGWLLGWGCDSRDPTKRKSVTGGGRGWRFWGRRSNFRERRKDLMVQAGKKLIEKLMEAMGKRRRSLKRRKGNEIEKVELVQVYVKWFKL